MVTKNEQLTSILQSLAHGLLQYLGESWLWTAQDSTADRATLENLVADQQDCIALLGDLIISRNLIVDFGKYPTVYTDLHYLALDFVLAELLKDQTELAGKIEQTIPTYWGNEKIVAVLQRILGTQKEIVSELKTLSQKYQTAKAG